MTRVVTIYNAKGGAGKTTCVVHIAAALAQKGNRVLVVDMDPQANATSWLDCKDVDDGADLLAIFQDKRNRLKPRPTVIPNVSILPGGFAMASLPMLCATKSHAMGRLRKPLLDSDFDIVLIDTPPTVSQTIYAALYASDAILIPVKSDVFCVEGIEQAYAVVEDAEEGCNRQIKFAGVLVTEHDKRNKHEQTTLIGLEKELSTMVFPEVVRINSQFKNSADSKQPLLTFKPNNDGSISYEIIARELQRRLEVLL